MHCKLLVNVVVAAYIGAFLITYSWAYRHENSAARSYGLNLVDKYIKAGSRARFSSDQEFTDAHERLVGSAKNTVLRYILELNPECDWKCHAVIMSFVNGDHDSYEVLSPIAAVVPVTVLQLENMLQDDYIAGLIAGYAPLIAESKIHTDIQPPIRLQQHQQLDVGVLSGEGPEYKEKVAEEVKEAEEAVQLTVEIGALSTEEFLNFLSSVLTDNEDDNDIDNEKSTSSNSNTEKKKRMNKKKKFAPDEVYIAYHDWAVRTHVPGKRVAVRVVVLLPHLVYDVAHTLASRWEVRWVAKYYKATAHNRWSRGVVDSGEAYNEPLRSVNITGEGQVIGVVDSGIDMRSGFFYDANTAPPYGTIDLEHRKVVQYLYWDGSDHYEQSGHGTHVAGTIAGQLSAQFDYGDMRRYQGVASGAKIAFFDVEDGAGSFNVPPSNIGDTMFLPMYSAGARIMSNSWGSVFGDGAYTDDSHDVDQFMWAYPDSLVVISAGNEGNNDACCNTHTVSAPATAKNCLTVGASYNAQDAQLAFETPAIKNGKLKTPKLSDRDDIHTVAKFSSRGPTSDGRLKPDVMAPGLTVTSALGESPHSDKPNNYVDYSTSDGTSMSCPAVAGIAARIRQYLMEGYYPSGMPNPVDAFIPSGALLKALVVASTEYLRWVEGVESEMQVGPNINQGHGRVALKNILNFGPSLVDPINLYMIGGVAIENLTLIQGNKSSAATSLLPPTKYYRAIHSSDQVDIHTFRTRGSSAAIRVVLCYTDFPQQGYATDNIMLNLLTMKILEESSNIEFTPELPAHVSQLSNLQVIDIGTPLIFTDYTVHVSVVGNLSVGPQPYSLVVVAREALTYLNDSHWDQKYNNIRPYPSISETNRNVIIALSLILCIIWLLDQYIKYLYKKYNDVDSYWKKMTTKVKNLKQKVKLKKLKRAKLSNNKVAAQPEARAPTGYDSSEAVSGGDRAANSAHPPAQDVHNNSNNNNNNSNSKTPWLFSTPFAGKKKKLPPIAQPAAATPTTTT